MEAALLRRRRAHLSCVQRTPARTDLFRSVSRALRCPMSMFYDGVLSPRSMAAWRCLGCSGDAAECLGVKRHGQSCYRITTPASLNWYHGMRLIAFVMSSSQLDTCVKRRYGPRMRSRSNTRRPDRNREDTWPDEQFRLVNARGGGGKAERGGSISTDPSR
jgi:hypothetical protein